MADLSPPFKETNAHAEFRKQYMAAFAKQYAVADFTVLMDLSEDVPVALKRIYVPLRFTQCSRGEDRARGDEIGISGSSTRLTM